MAVRPHPFGAGQMAFPGAPRAGGLSRWIDLKNNPSDLGPIRAFSLGVEKPQIGDDVVLVIPCQRVGCGGGVVDFWGEGGFWHGVPSTNPDASIREMLYGTQRLRLGRKFFAVTRRNEKRD